MLPFSIIIYTYTLTNIYYSKLLVKNAKAMYRGAPKIFCSGELNYTYQDNEIFLYYPLYHLLYYDVKYNILNIFLVYNIPIIAVVFPKSMGHDPILSHIIFFDGSLHMIRLND